MGIGPGAHDLVTPRARNVLMASDVIVGYHVYLKLLEPELKEGKEIISTPMRKEIERCTMAIDKVLGGRRTSIVSSGDSGIYGMAGLVLELLYSRGLIDKVSVEIVPGIPSFVAVSSLLGAPLMHDFAVISLSDLLTPWDRIEKRVLSASEGDFVIVLYNPRSKKRDWQIKRAIELIREHRSPDTPVGIVRNAAREDESVFISTLSHIDYERIDMLTTVIVGNSSSRIISDRIITPRGYTEKYI